MGSDYIKSIPGVNVKTSKNEFTIKSYEKVLDLAKNKFEYNETSIKQIEEKSRSFTLLITTITGFLTLIYKQDDIIKKLSGEILSGKILSNTFALLLLLNLILIILSLFVSYYLTYLTLKPTKYTAIGTPEAIQNSIIDNSNSDYQSVISAIEVYTLCSLNTDEIIKNKSKYMKQQSELALYFIFFSLAFLVLGGIKS